MDTVPHKRTLLWLIASLVLAAALVAGLQLPVSASINSNMAVSATVTGACSGLTANPLAFGNVTQSSSGNVDATTSVTFTCSSGTVWNLDSDMGQNSNGGPTRRMLFSGFIGAYLGYALYKDSTFTNQWGTGVPVPGTPFTGMGTGTQQSVTVFGRIPGGQGGLVLGGPYTDIVSVTLTF